MDSPAEMDPPARVDADAGRAKVQEPAADEAPQAPRPRRERKPTARIRPQELAAARGGALEGLDWLGRTPGPEAPLLYRVLCFVARVVLFGVFRLRVDISGRELLPKRGYLLVSAAHRGWADPFIVIHALPIEPRPWFLGSGPSTFTSRWREALIKRAGGLLPVWRGGVGVETHVRSARAVIDAGGVFVQMPEGTVNGPVGTIGPFRPGAALIALRVNAPIVPIAMAGTEELYVGHRMAARILPPTSMADLLGPSWDGRLPQPGTREELDLARQATESLADLLRPAVEALQPLTVDPPGRPKWLRHWLTWLFLGPGVLQHDRPAARPATPSAVASADPSPDR
jgi:1-acyl-sn-glycerol-3-phosphate acyltransferase